MAKMTLKGFEEYERALSRMKASYQDDVIGACVYAGANVVANAVKNSIRELPEVNGFGTEKHPLPGGVNAIQKKGLLDGFGISKMQNDNGYRNVKLGFDGWNDIRTKKFPNGQPNQLVARGCESGTSWKQKKPFVRPAVNKSRGKCVEVMKSTCDAAVASVMAGSGGKKDFSLRYGGKTIHYVWKNK